MLYNFSKIRLVIFASFRLYRLLYSIATHKSGLSHHYQIKERHMLSEGIPQSLRFFMLCMIIFFMANGPVQAETFMQFRGPDRSGIFPEKNLLQEWPKGGPKRLAQVDGLGQGYSSPVISGNRIFITGMTKGVEYLYAFDLDGNLKGRKEYGRAARSYSGTRSTPTVTADSIYLTSGAGEVVSFDKKTGIKNWSVAAAKKFAARHGSWGCSESPLVVDNKVIYTPGSAKTTMVALDAKTGETVWMSKSVGGGTAYASPILVERGEKKLVVNLTSTHMIGVNLEDGTMEWAIPFPPGPGGLVGINAPSPIYHNGHIFFTCGYDQNGVMLELSEDGSSAKIAWINPVLDTHHGGVVLHNGYIYGSNWLNNQSGNWVCLDWKTGQTMWEKRWYTKGSVVYADGRLYILEESRGNVGLLTPSPNGFQLVSTFQMKVGDGPYWAHPIIHNGRLYLRRGNAMNIYDIQAR
jgi:outer membrane protein assembly factor BamB